MISIGVPNPVSRVHFEDFEVLNVQFPRQRIFQKGIEDCRTFSPYLGEDVALFHLLRSFPSGERRLVKCHVAYQVEGVEVLVQLAQQLLKEDALCCQVLK